MSDNLFENNQLFFAITESWLDSHKDAELKIDGYQLFRSDRKRRKRSKRGRLSGGVAVYVHDSLAVHMEVSLQYSNGAVEVIGLYSSSENLFLAIVYRQPDDSAGGNPSGVAEFKPALEKITAVLNDIGEPSPNTIICGDFNLPRFPWNSNCETGSNSLHDSLAHVMNKLF